jgi:hypothetical protein
VVEDKGGGKHAIQELDGVQPLDDLRLGGGFQRDNQLADLHAAMDRNAGHAGEMLRNGRCVRAAAVHH